MPLVEAKHIRAGLMLLEGIAATCLERIPPHQAVPVILLAPAAAWVS